MENILSSLVNNSTASNNLVNIPTLFVKDLGWKDKDVLTVEYKNGKIIITKED